METTIITQTILDQILALSNERQQLWRIAHRDKFSSSWWKRHNRIEVIGKQLVRLWHVHRVEMSGYREWQPVEVNRMASDVFDDYRQRAGSDVDGVWRIEDEASHQHRYISVAEGLRDNKRAIQSMIQLN